MTHNAELVRLLCPLCRWESEAERVVPDEPNGLWQARQRRLADYHDHFASAHRPPPLSALTEERTHA